MTEQILENVTTTARADYATTTLMFEGDVEIDVTVLHTATGLEIEISALPEGYGLTVLHEGEALYEG